MLFIPHTRHGCTGFVRHFVIISGKLFLLVVSHAEYQPLFSDRNSWTWNGCPWLENGAHPFITYPENGRSKRTSSSVPSMGLEWHTICLLSRFELSSPTVRLCSKACSNIQSSHLQNLSGHQNILCGPSYENYIKLQDDLSHHTDQGPKLVCAWYQMHFKIKPGAQMFCQLLEWHSKFPMIIN